VLITSCITARAANKVPSPIPSKPSKTTSASTVTSHSPTLGDKDKGSTMKRRVRITKKKKKNGSKVIVVGDLRVFVACATLK
jgi:pyoverdine/dityrosine biosynthesis protein Dit1